jgi:hypothetical protein
MAELKRASAFGLRPDTRRGFSEGWPLAAKDWLKWNGRLRQNPKQYSTAEVLTAGTGGTFIGLFGTKGRAI